MSVAQQQWLNADRRPPSPSDSSAVPSRGPLRSAGAMSRVGVAFAKQVIQREEKKKRWSCAAWAAADQYVLSVRAAVSRLIAAAKISGAALSGKTHHLGEEADEGVCEQPHTPETRSFIYLFWTAGFGLCVRTDGKAARRFLLV